LIAAVEECDMAIEIRKVRAPRDAVITRRDHVHRQVLSTRVPAPATAARAARDRRAAAAKRAA